MGIRQYAAMALKLIIWHPSAMITAHKMGIIQIKYVHLNLEYKPYSFLYGCFFHFSYVANKELLIDIIILTVIAIIILQYAIFLPLI